MLLAELNIRHTRRHMPTRRVAVDDGYLPTSGPAFGGVLIGAVIAEYVPGLDEEQFDALARLVDVATRGGLTVPRIALRYRLQTDTHGLDLSRHRITSADVERGSVRPILELDLHGPPAPQVIGALMAAVAAPAVGPAGGVPLRRRRDRPPRRAARGPRGPAPATRASRACARRGPGTTDAPSAATLGRRVARASRRSGGGRWRCSASTPATAIERDDVQRRFRRLVRLAHPDHGARERGRRRAHRRARRGARAAAVGDRRRLGLSLGCRRIGALPGNFGRMAANPLHVTVTGAAGQIGYALVHRIASGQLLGPDQPVVLRLLEIEPALPALEGVVMELEDGAHPLLVGIEATADLKTAFDGTSWALLVGSIPRKAGMERGDLLKVNGGIFKPQGQAINDHAASDVRVLVVGNPCNTNCLIARSNAPDVPADRWFAMTRLDENRAKTQLAKKAGVQLRVRSRNVAIWGNHSATQFPDFAHARIDGKPGARGDHRHRVAAGRVHRDGAEARRRGDREARRVVGGVGRARGDRLGEQRALRRRRATTGTRSRCAARGEYGVPEGLQFGFPVRSDGSSWTVVEGIEHDDFAQGKIDAHHRGARRRARRGPLARPDLGS